MIRQEDIIDIEIDGRTWSAFRLGTKDGGMPSHLFQGEKKDGILIRDGVAEPWMWTSIHYEGNDRYVYFPKMDIHSLEELSTVKRADALKIVRNIATGLRGADREWLDLETGVFPLYRIFIVGKSDVLLLPPDIGTVVGLLRTPEERRDEVNVLIKKGNEESFLLIAEMVQLLYFALTGFLPYIDEKVRHWKYAEFPLEDALASFGEALDIKTCGFMNVVLHAKRQQMRDVGGNRLSSEALSWFLKNTEDLEWNVDSRDSVPDVTASPEWDAWTEKTEKGSRKSDFWRKKGAIITGCTIVGAVVLWLVGGWIFRALKPPVTAGMTQEEIVYAVYEAQNTVEPEVIEECVKGTSLPQEMDVINLFVNSRVRGAYEMVSPIIRPDRWIEEGKGAIPQGNLIYGVTDISLERIDENTIYATSVWWGPYYSDEVDEDFDPQSAPASIPIEVAEITQSFIFEWNSRGWWDVIESGIIEDTPIDVIDVPLIRTVPQ